MGKAGKKLLFQDEPEEPVKLSRAPKLFGEEPAEESKSSSSTSKRPRVQHVKPRPQATSVLFGDEGEETSRVRPATSVLFGDEGEEQSHAQPAAAPQVSDEDESDEEPQPATLNLDWSAMKLFSHATFLQKQVSESKPQRQKRVYDNSKRLNEAESKVKVIATSFKSHALQSGRLQILASKPECKCSLDAIMKQTTR